ncbi:MAG: bifunctional DNA-formamidopyrimidine glycosylase/DNA-(apurinic or apyrimidinic site) lyase [Nevskiales bacterium]|nr:bifunctional DNA-formamidopyrimidine glycosylase/DNA-(apurinic or apyrimidinic site) lyase [Nevskiales bacterium]
MPELPEVETVRRGLEPHLVGCTIEEVRVHERRLRWPVERGFAQKLRGRIIRSVERRAKYLLLRLDNGDRLILHLGMSGRLLLLEPATPRRKHDHLDLRLSSHRRLCFHDPRRFGTALLWPASRRTHALLKNLGPEPLSDAFDGNGLFEKSRGRTVAVKNFLMDGRIVAGVGNIYASESLFHAGIRPGTTAGRIPRARYRRLAEAVRAVLGAAVEQGGTTLKDHGFVGAHTDPGRFQVRLAVYDRAGAPCVNCGTSIRRLLVGQRSSFYCPRCQR